MLKTTQKASAIKVSPYERSVTLSVLNVVAIAKKATCIARESKSVVVKTFMSVQLPD